MKPLINLFSGIIMCAIATSGFANPALKDSQVYMATLHTQQYQQMYDFYSETLQLPVVADNPGFAEFSVNGLRLSIASYEGLDSFLNSPHLKTNRQGSGVGIGFKLESAAAVDELYAQLKSRNVNFVEGPELKPWGEYTAFFSDPDGNIHELVSDQH